MSEYESLKNMLIECRDQFLYYEKQHLAKETEASLIKAKVNAAMATAIDDVLAKAALHTKKKAILDDAVTIALAHYQKTISDLEGRVEELLEASTRNLLRARNAESSFEPLATVVIAKAAHGANKAWCEVQGDFSQVDWKDAPAWQRESAINGVNFHLDNPTATDSASHDNWMKEKLNNGWVYGEVKDEVAKTHPCLVPFNKLPAPQQFKDKLFR